MVCCPHAIHQDILEWAGASHHGSRTHCVVSLMRMLCRLPTLPS